MIHRKRGLLYPLLPSRSYADARIETLFVMYNYVMNKSRSYADARIETYLLHARELVELIAFLCGRADWNNKVVDAAQYSGYRVPMRTRGLKRRRTAPPRRFAASRSYADARIETYAPLSTYWTHAIAFLCGRADWNSLRSAWIKA